MADSRSWNAQTEQEDGEPPEPPEQPVPQEVINAGIGIGASIAGAVVRDQLL